MRFIANKNDLANELKYYQGIFDKKMLLDILSNIKIEADKINGFLKLSATNLEISLNSKINVDIQEEGDITVDGKDFHDLIVRMPEDEVEVYVDEFSLVVTNKFNKASKYKLPIIAVDDFPKLPEPDFTKYIEINTISLRAMINKTYFIVSPDIKYTLDGALLKLKSPNEFEVVATDGHRLGYTFNNNTDEMREDDFQYPLDFIISRKMLYEIQKISDDKQTGRMKFTFDSNNIYFDINNRILSSRMIDHRFPNFKAAIPEICKYNFILNENFNDILKRISVIKNKTNKVNFKITKEKLFLLSVAENGAEANEEYDIILYENAEKYSGDSIFDISFNLHFFLDYFAKCNYDDISVEFNDGESAFVLKQHRDADFVPNHEYIYVIMPLQS